MIVAEHHGVHLLRDETGAFSLAMTLELQESFASPEAALDFLRDVRDRLLPGFWNAVDLALDRALDEKLG